MPTPKRGSRLGGGPAHQKQILANLASDLFRHGRIKTTEAKGKMLRPYAEKLITKAKQGDLAARRAALAKLHDRDVVAYLFEDVGPRFADRNGGYTRLRKLGPRKGDNAPMVLVELTELGESYGDEVIEDSKVGRSRGLFGRRRRTAAEPEAPGSTLLDDYEDLEEEDEVSDEDVAAAVAQATSDGDAGDSPESADSPSSVDSPSSPDSPSSVDSPDEADDADETDEKKDA